VKGREYLRVSFDRSGREKSNDEQHDENEAAAPTLGIEAFGKPYRDVGSASRHQRKRRDDFDQLLTDLGSGHFGADVLVLWESSRGSRKVGEWVSLIEACEEAEVRIAVTTHGRCYDPANPRDRRTLLEDAVDGEYESAKISVRGRRSAASAAAEGQPWGRIPYGYRRVYDSTTGRLIAQEPDIDEAAIVVEAYNRVAAGHSLTAICKDFKARGVTSRTGVTFGTQHLRGLLLRPVYRGRRVHSPGKRHTGTPTTPPDNVYEAQWKPLVPDDLWFDVQARLTDPSRLTVRPGRAKHLATACARCDVCGGRMASTDKFGARRYMCARIGHVTIKADELDAWVESEILAVLTRPDVVERLLPQAVDPQALADARDEVARVRAQHADLVAALADGTLSATAAAGAEPGILGRLRLAEERVAELTVPAGLRSLVDPGPKVTERWQVMPIEAKREVARLLFSRDVLGSLTVARVVDGDRSAMARVRLDGKRPLQD
jgi:DNA invertase Pin-like site-specific DNA recombinase